MTVLERSEKRKAIRQLAKVDLEVRQSQLIKILYEKYDISICPGDFSRMLNGVMNTPRTDEILAMTEEILIDMQKHTA